MKKGNYDNDSNEISDVVVYQMDLSDEDYELLLEDEELFEELMEMF